jgi:hypothetical protein
MNGIARITAVAALVMAVSLSATSTAAASATIGQASAGGFACGSFTYVQVSTGGPPAYAAPGSGVITSWSTVADGVANQTMALKVMRVDPSNPAKFFTLARDNRPLASLLSVNTFPNASSPAPVHIPIAAGDLLGMTGSSSAACPFASGSASDQWRSTSADTAVNPSTSQPFNAPFGPQRLDISAVIEADADHDGFGDETQDLCPTNATTQGACPATGKRAAALKKCKHKHGKKRKKCKKKARRLPV